jgi:hypothetical protein
MQSERPITFIELMKLDRAFYCLLGSFRNWTSMFTVQMT